MCSVLIRLLHTFVLTSFLWSILFPTLSFANYEPVFFESHPNGHTLAHFSIGIHKLPTPRHHAKQSYVADPIQEPLSENAEFTIPIGKTNQETQALIDQTFLQSIYKKLKANNDGFTWTSYGLNFHLGHTGDLTISYDAAEPYIHEEPLYLYYPNGDIIFKGDIALDHIILDTNHVFQTGHLTLQSLTLQGTTYLHNQGTLSLRALYFDSLGDQSSRPVFINEGAFVDEETMHITGNGTYINASTGIIKIEGQLTLSHARFENNGRFDVHNKTTLALTEAFTNKGGILTFHDDAWITGKFAIDNKTQTGKLLPSLCKTGASKQKLSGFLFRKNLHFKNFRGSIDSRNFFNAQTMSGYCRTLDNYCEFSVDTRFDFFRIGNFTNHTAGHIRGRGNLAIINGNNRGSIQSEQLDLTIVTLFTNKNSLDIDNLTTQGKGSFVQRKHLKSKRVLINNRSFHNQSHIDQSDLDLSFGECVEQFENKADILLKLRSLFFSRTTLLRESSTNYGFIETDLLDNGRSIFINAKQIRARTWRQQGMRFENRLNALIHIYEQTTFQGSVMTNHGQITFDGVISGQLRQLDNTGRFRFNAAVAMTGSQLTNKGIIDARDQFKWRLQLLDNAGQMFIVHNHIQTKQLVNRLIIRWTHHNFGASHLLNLGLIEQTNNFSAAFPAFKQNIQHQTDFKEKTFENIGVFKGEIPSPIQLAGRATITSSYANYVNRVLLESEHLLLAGKKLENAGVIVIKEDITGTIDDLMNTHIIAVHGKIDVLGKTLTNRGKISTVKGITYNGQRLTNAGEFSSQGDITGTIDHIENGAKALPQADLVDSLTHGIISNGTIDLNGQKLDNKGTLQAKDKATYKGKTYTSTKTSQFYGASFSLTTTDPLVLYGAFHGATGGHFSGLTIQNYGDIHIKRGLTTFSGALSNAGTINIDDLFYISRTLVNSGVMEMNRYSRTNPLDLFDNRNRFIVRNGSLHIKKLKNKSTLQLLGGQYTIDTLETDSCSEMTVDELSLTSETLGIDGFLDVARFNGRRDGYDSMRFWDNTIFRSGYFKTKSLFNFEKLTLGSGVYYSELFDNLFSASLLSLLHNAHLMVDDIDNKGKILSSVSLTLDPTTSYLPLDHHMRQRLNQETERHHLLHTLTTIGQTEPTRQLKAPTFIRLAERYKQRSDLYNTIPFISDSEQITKKKAVYKHSVALITQLKDMNPSECISDEAKKKHIFQTVMATELITHTYDETQKSALNFEAILPKAKYGTPAYKYFKFLKDLSLLSKKCLTYIRTHTYKTLDFIVDNTAFDIFYGMDSQYLTVDKPTFIQWFKEVLEQHKDGFFSLGYASLTIKGHPTDDTSSFTRLGEIHTSKELTIQSTYCAEEHDWLDWFLFRHHTNFHIGMKILNFKTPRFVNRKHFTRPRDLPLHDRKPYDMIPYFVHVQSPDFQNKGTFTINGLIVDSSTFRNGNDNDHMGTIHCYGSLMMDVEEDVDNRFGMIEGTEKGHIKSRGRILNGHFKEENKPIETNLDQALRRTGVPYIEHRKKRNGAKIVMRNVLILESESDISNDFGLLYGFYEKLDQVEILKKKPSFLGLIIKTPGTVFNKSGHISSSVGIEINGRKLINSIGEEKETGRLSYSPALRSTGCDCNFFSRIYHESDPGYIETTNGNIYFNLSKGENIGSYILSNHDVYLNGEKYGISSALPRSFKHQSVSDYFLLQRPSVKETPYRNKYEYEHQYHGAFKSGKAIHIATDLFTLTGSVNAPTVTVNAKFVEAIGARNIRQDPVTGNFIINLGQFMERLMENIPMFIDRNGTIQGNLLGGEAIPDFDPSCMFSFSPTASHQPRLSPLAMQFAEMHLFSSTLGTLSAYGKSGDQLSRYMHECGKKNLEQLIVRKKLPRDNNALRQVLQLLIDGCIYYEVMRVNGHDVQNPYVVITQNMIIKKALEMGITGNRVEINGEVRAHDVIFGTYAPTSLATDIMTPLTKQAADPRTSTAHAHVPDIRVPTYNEQSHTPSSSSIHDASGHDQRATEPSLIFNSPTNIHMVACVVSSHDGIRLQAEDDIYAGSTAKRVGTADVKQAMSFEAADTIEILSGGNVDTRAIDVTADNFLVQAAGHFADQALALYEERTTVEQNKKSTTTVTETWCRHAVSSYNLKNGVIINAGTIIDLVAPKVRAKFMHLLAQKRVTVHDVMDSYTRSTAEHVSGSGWFGKDKEIYSAYQSARSKGIDAGDTPITITLRERGDVELTNVTIKDLTVDSKGGRIHFRLGKNFEAFSRSEKGSNAFWQYQSMYMEDHQTATQSTIGRVHVISSNDHPSTDHPVEIMIESVRGQTANFLKQIEADGGIITELFWDEVHHQVHRSAGGPTAATAALIAIAVSAITMGTGAAAAVGGLMASAAGCAATGAVSTMFAAGFTSVCTSAVMALANNEGDISKAAKTFDSDSTLKSAGMAMMAAGVTYGLLKQFDLPTTVTEIDTFGGHASHQTVHMAARTAAEATLTGHTDLKAVSIGMIAGTLGSYFASNIGMLHANGLGDLEANLVHKTLHTLNGAGQGLIMGVGKGILSQKGVTAEILGEAVAFAAAGAGGSLVAEAVVDMVTPTGGIAWKPVSARPSETRIIATQAAARIVAGAVAMLAGMSPDQVQTAIFTATTAVENNFAKAATQAGLRHVGIKVTLYEDSVDETTLKTEAEAAGVDTTEQQQVRLKLTQIQRQHIDNAPSLADTLTEIPISPEAIQAIKIHMLKTCAKNLAAVNQRMHQVISEHPWAEKTLTGSLHIFGDSVRAMLYIDMCALGAVGGSAICRSLNVNPKWTHHCALLGSAVSAFYTGLVLEPGLNDLMTEGVNQLGHIAADHLGDTAEEKVAIQRLTRDTVVAGGVILGGRYLQSRVAGAASQGAAQCFAVRSGGTTESKINTLKPSYKPSKVHDYSRGYLKEAENFINETPKDFNGTLSKPLRVVSYHSDKSIGPGSRSLKYWTPVSEANAMGTMEDVVNRLALLNAWGARSHVSVAEIPAGVSVRFMHGRAALKEGKINSSEIRPGGSVQYCFEKFDEAWIKATNPLP